MKAAALTRLALTNFRSYRHLILAAGRGLMVLVGPNGAGKTNLLEAISMLAPGRGLRRATLDDLAFDEGDGSWAVAAEVEGPGGLVQLGTGIEPPVPEQNQSRKFRIDREPVSSTTAFADHLRLVWLVPTMDGVFAGPASERRRLLDRFVSAVHPEHGARVNALERALRSRNRLLEAATPDPHWLDAAEHEAAELAVAVAAARGETVQRLSHAIALRADAPFPAAALSLRGWMDDLIAASPAIEVEDRYRVVLKEARARDAAAGRTLEGPHLSDLDVIYAPKRIAARDASTGEQKALLIGLVLAHARLVTEMTGLAPVILLDEVVAHLDPGRRGALFDALGALAAQVWMTGADPGAFGGLPKTAQVLTVEPGAVKAVATLA